MISERAGSEPEPIPGFERRSIADGREWTVCDFTPRWHAASGKLLGTGQSVIYEGEHVLEIRPRTTEYSVYDPSARLDASPDAGAAGSSEVCQCGRGKYAAIRSSQWHILLPVYFKEAGYGLNTSTIVRCRFDGETLCYLEHGTELTHEVPRGLGESSLTRFNGRFYLTLRNDQRGYVATSEDGLHYNEPQP